MSFLYRFKRAPENFPITRNLFHAVEIRRFFRIYEKYILSHRL